MAPTFRPIAKLLATLGQDFEAHAHQTFRALGGSGSRFGRKDWQHMAMAITSLEDRMEVERPRFDRTRIREARRALELAADARADRQAA